jgi:hypothetical protein
MDMVVRKLQRKVISEYWRDKHNQLNSLKVQRELKLKLLNLLLIVTSLFGYLSWGADNSAFLFQAEYEVLSKLFTNPESAVHPFTIIPLFGQVLLLIILFQKKPRRILTYLGIACIGVLLGFMFIVGILGMKLSIILSTLPFLLTAIYVLRVLRAKVNL